MVWFRVAGVLVHGVKGGLGPKLQGSHGTSIPSIASIIPKMWMMRGSGGTIPWGGGGYVAQGLVHVCNVCMYVMSGDVM